MSRDIIFLKEDETTLPVTWEQVVDVIDRMWVVTRSNERGLVATPPEGSDVIIDNIELGVQFSIDGTEEQQAIAAAAIAQLIAPGDGVRLYIDDGSECREVDRSMTVDDVWDPRTWFTPEWARG